MPTATQHRARGWYAPLQAIHAGEPAFHHDESYGARDRLHRPKAVADDVDIVRGKAD